MPAVPDILAPDLRVLFCGINPSLMSAECGHHFARPGNRFWPALHGAGFTPRRLTPEEDGLLPSFGLGVTNVADRPTRAAAELPDAELRAGFGALPGLVAGLRPRVLAILGLGAWRVVSGDRRAAGGLQERTVGARPVWVLPNPSGLNANHQLADLVRLFGELRSWVDAEPTRTERRGPQRVQREPPSRL